MIPGAMDVGVVVSIVAPFPLELLLGLRVDPSVFEFELNKSYDENDGKDKPRQGTCVAHFEVCKSVVEEQEYGGEHAVIRTDGAVKSRTHDIHSIEFLERSDETHHHVKKDERAELGKCDRPELSC